MDRTSRRMTPETILKHPKMRRRPQYSCSNCYQRKVKCDRVKPCHSCCLRGTPSECYYPTSEEDRHYMEQSIAIASLQRTCESLKQRLDEARNATKTVVSSSVSSESLSARGISHDNRDGPFTQEVNRSLSTTMCLQTRRPQQALSRRISSSKAFTEVFLQRFLDSFSLQSASDDVGFVAFKRGAEMRAFSPFLCRAFDAASLIFIGRREGDYTIDAKGQREYVAVLKELQGALNSPERRILEETLLAVVLFTVIEAYKGSTKDAMLRHQLGGLQLLQVRTPYRHRYGIGRSLYVDLRLYWVSAALVIRRPTFLASNEWRTVPWPVDGPPKDILHLLLDIMIEIPAYLYEIDQMLEVLQAGSLSPPCIIDFQTTLSQRASDIDRRLRRWRSTCADQYPLGLWWEETNSPDEAGLNQFPVFQCRDLSTMSIVTPKQLVYPDMFILTCMLYYWAARLIVSQPYAGLIETVRSQERYLMACNICRSLRNYVETVPGGLLSRLMFILRVVYDTFPEGTVERHFVSQVFSYISKAHRSTIFERRCSELALKSG